jgi:hypothetical protein
MTVFDDLAAEQERLADILGGLDEAQWLSASGAAGWTIADVGASVWEFGPAEAESGIAGPAGDFCRVATRRLAPARAGFVAAEGHRAARRRGAAADTDLRGIGGRDALRRHRLRHPAQRLGDGYGHAARLG